MSNEPVHGEGAGCGGSEVKRWALDEIRAELDRFEAAYGVPSDRLGDAFVVEGELRETADFRRWDFVYACWQHAQRK